MTNTALNQEKSPTKIGAFFKDKKTAEEAAANLINAEKLASSQVKLVKPGSEPDIVDKKLAPEDHNVARTMVSAHVWFGIGGIVAGLLIALLLVLIGPTATQSSPFFTVFALVFVGGIIGLLAGGFISLRPDQDPLIMKTHTANANDRWTLVVHGYDHEEIRKAEATLQRSGGDTIRTL